MDGSDLDHFLQVIVSLFNKMFDIGYFPSSWTKGFIVPIHKKGI
jgi:hypothetical protein